MQNLTIAETIRKNRKELFCKICVHQGQKQIHYSLCFQKNAMIASYCLKKGKVVILLNTVHSDRGIELLETESKAEVITYFNSKLTTKGGVDTMDQMERWFTSKQKLGNGP